MRALFADKDAFVFTTWSGGVPIDEFIKISETGFSKGVKIAHRANGCTVDIATSGPAKGQRALGKLKATITQRFTMPTANEGETCQVDVDADCRLCFFVEKKNGTDWKCHFFKGFYEKDKMTPVDPRRVPVIDDAKLAQFPEGYQYLAYGQSAAYKIKLDLPQSRGAEHDHFYESFIKWLDGDRAASVRPVAHPTSFIAQRWSTTSPLAGANSATAKQHPSSGRPSTTSPETSPSAPNKSANQDNSEAEGAKSREQEMMNATHYGTAEPKEGVATKGSKLEHERREAGKQGE
ncbi:hypothetical protein OIV83_005645 [Microbotryomycetes sp. JL201]|nr:hypothetical protein OIV83_005645 [Microbotryomycetes sp. JL201]